MTASQLFAEISPALSTRIVEDIFTSDKELYRVAVAAVAQAKKLRPIFLERQPRAERNKTLVSGLSRTDMSTISGNVLSGWLVKHQSALLADFLDALKIKHDKGVVEDLPKSVNEADLQNAVNMLLEKYPAEVVGLYLRAFNDMNEAGWPNLQKMFDSDVRLMLGQ